MDFIKTLVIIALATLFVLISAAVISGFYRHQKKKARRAQRMTPRKELHEFLKDTSFSRNYFNGLYFPVYQEGTMRVLRYQRIDNIVVCSGGVLILTVFDKIGYVDNSNDDVWVHIKDDERFNIEAPTAQLDACKSALNGVFKRSGLSRIPVYDAVVFADGRSQPLGGYDRIVYMSELELLLHDMKKKSTLSTIEQFYVTKALRNAGVTKQKILKNKL